MNTNLLKSVLVLFTLILYILPAFGQSPYGMSYQAVIRNSSDALVTNTQIGMQISILQGSASGTAVYVETQTPTTNANGLVALEIGNGNTSDDFSSIDWSADNYFIKTETDPEGGTNYTITGVSQLLSVPYALYAKTAESVSGGITESDPTYTSSEAANITATDITNLGNLSGVNTGDQDLSTLATKTALGDSTAQVRSEIPDVSGFLSTEIDPTFTSSQAANIDATDIINLDNLSGTNTGDQDLSTLATKTALGDSTAQVRSEIPCVPTGTQVGEMQFWDGTAWVTVAAGNDGQRLTYVNGLLTWIDNDANVDPETGLVWKDVTSTTGEIWMDRNLGASQVATNSTDADAYGDLYQWGRAVDGHESRTSNITTTLATSDTPGHDDFITNSSSPYDWRSSQNDNLWQGVSGTNNPCPSGYRLPTEAEWEAERTSWSSNDAAGAFNSLLKLPVAGRRDYSCGLILSVGSSGTYWSSTVGGTSSRGLSFGSSTANVDSGNRANGLSVRCLKD